MIAAPAWERVLVFVLETGISVLRAVVSICTKEKAAAQGTGVLVLAAQIE
jgi:hypothetical protein